MKANQTEGKRHSWKERGKKILSPALLCLCAVMLLVWAVQLLFFEDTYRFIKSWKLEDVMEQVCEHLDKEHLHNHFCINSVSFKDGGKYNLVR